MMTMLNKWDPAKISKRIACSNIGVFEEIFEEPICRLLKEVGTYLDFFESKYPNIHLNTEAILYSVGTACRNELLDIFTNVFISDLSQKKCSLVGTSSKERYNDYVKRYLLPNYKHFFCDDSEPKRILDTRIMFAARSVIEMFDRLGIDQELLRGLLDSPVTLIENVSIGEGDTHNEGRNVATITLAGGKKIVYKPHSVYNDVILDKILEWFNKYGVSVPVKHLRVVERGNYGWQEFAEHKACTNEEEVHAFMYRTGCLIFTAYIMGSTDLHAENLIACGEHPIIVDTETLLSNSSSLNGHIDRMVDGWPKMLRHSVFSSLLLPTDILKRNEPGRVMSGLLGGVQRGKNNRKSLSLVHRGTDQIAIEEVEDRAEAGQNRNYAIYCGKPVNPCDYVESITKGFLDAYYQVEQNKDAFIVFLKQVDLNRGHFRIVVRNTELYAKYLILSHHPRYINDIKSREFVFNHLKGNKGYLSDKHEQLVRMEMDQLLNSDVPYFYTKYRSKDIYVSQENAVRDFMEQTIEDQFLNRIRRLNPVDAYRQEYFIRIALTRRSGSMQSRHRYFTGIDPHCLQNREHAAKAVIKWIYEFREKYHRIPEKTGEIPMYYSVAPRENQDRLAIEAPILYEGIGSALFYIQYFKLIEDAHSDQACQFVDFYADERFWSELESNTENHIGVFTGLFSHIYLNYYAYVNLGDQEYWDKMHLLACAIEKKIEKGSAADIMSGYAGCIIVSLRILDQHPECDIFMKIAEKCARHLYESFANDSLPKSAGFSHGYAGISAALIMMSKTTDNDDYYRAAIDLIKREKQLYDWEQNRWLSGEEHSPCADTWCYGSTGILVGRVITLDYIKKADRALVEEDIRLCLDQLAKDVTGKTDGEVLCHGLAGNLDILLWYTKKTGDSAWMPFIHTKTEHLLARIISEGIFYGNVSKTLDVSFMTGLTGIGYYLERYVDDSIPSVIALDI